MRFPALMAMAGAAGLLVPVPAAQARMSILYDTSETLAVLTDQAGSPPGLGVADGAWQQQPAPLYLPGSRHAWKVSGGAGSDATPSLIGRGADGMAALLRERIRRAGGHLVFLDELNSSFRGEDGAAFAAAMATLATEPSPWGGGFLAGRVHVYVPNPSSMLADPDRWGDAWRALALAGGVWLQTYRSPTSSSLTAVTPWTAAEWLAYPRGFAEALAAAGGDSGRLHLLMSEGDPAPGMDHARQWRLALTGPNCPILATGPGAYRLGNDAVTFLERFRQVFGTAPAPAGRSQIACLPDALLPPDRAAAVAGVLALGDARTALPERASPPLVRAGRASTITIRLGADPLGLAARLGLEPAALRTGVAPRLQVSGPGIPTRTVSVAADGTARVSVTPRAAGAVFMTLLVSGAPIRALARDDLDLVSSADATGAAYPTMRRRLLASPNGWQLAVPLGASTDAAAPPVSVVDALPTPSGPARVELGLAGPAELRRGGVDARRVAVVQGQVRSGAGRALAGRDVILRPPDGRGRRVRTDAAGRFQVAIGLASGTLTAVVPRTKARAARRIVAPRIPAARIALGTRRGGGRLVVIGRLLAADGKGARGVAVRVRTPSGGTLRPRVDPAGRFRVVLRPARGRVVAFVPGTRVSAGRPVGVR